MGFNLDLKAPVLSFIYLLLKQLCKHRFVLKANLCQTFQRIPTLGIMFIDLSTPDSLYIIVVSLIKHTNNYMVLVVIIPDNPLRPKENRDKISLEARCSHLNLVLNTL